MKNFKLRKLIASLLIAASALAINPVGASAEWKQDSTGWWYADGSSWYTGWKKIDGKWYYFERNGYMAHDRYVDGYYLNSNGYWDIYELQPTLSTTLQGVSVKYPSTWKKSTMNGLTVYYLDNQGTNVIATTLNLKGHTSKEYLDASIKCLKKISDFDQINTSTQIINGRTVDILDFEYKNESNLRVRLHQVFFYNNNNAYIFSLTRGSDISSADIMASFNDMLKTVTFE
ncbi:MULTISPECIES: cell wall-binding protein [unclassified Clostridium]|uniref:cell wall-binding protein n=1 Tax=unclassified Clostridium TaxID=2614128 RepID=UPI000298036C|nr:MULTISPECIES: cell wall-binding protein [unclassified Clostridium]EKQ57219.1 MAG: putative cell wall binding protein [Clostridium sp. Maddingley MBC34-26]